MKDCTSMFGHKYEARYQDSEPLNTDNLLEKPRQQYIHDICTRCGHIIGGNKLDAERGEG